MPGVVAGVHRDHVILNTACSVDHGCVIEDYASPGATWLAMYLLGQVRILEPGLRLSGCIGIINHAWAPGNWQYSFQRQSVCLQSAVFC